MKTQKFITVLFVLIAILSCDEPEQTFNEYLSAEAIINYLPDAYFSEGKLIYVNKQGEELTLLIHSQLSETMMDFEGKNYTAQNFEITLYRQDDPGFQIVLTGNNNYTFDGSVALSITGILMPLNASGSTWATVRFLNDKPTITIGDDFRETVLINNREYNNVYITIGKDGDEQFNSYSELDINSEYGVVAFRDENNLLWSIDRIED